MANGPHGVYVLRQPFETTRLTLTHRLRSGRFSPPRSAPRTTVDVGVGAVALAEDARGQLIAVWQSEPGNLMAAVSTNGVR